MQDVSAPFTVILVISVSDEKVKNECQDELSAILSHLTPQFMSKWEQ